VYQRFLWNAARNALAAGDITIYERAFRMAAQNLGSEAGVRNLQLPTPQMLARRMSLPLAFALDMKDFCTGLWLAEWALEHPDQIPAISWNHFSELSQTIAQEAIWEAR
jgi:hypothetical protein